MSVTSSYSEGFRYINDWETKVYEEHPDYSHGVDAWARAWMVRHLATGNLYRYMVMNNFLMATMMYEMLRCYITNSTIHWIHCIFQVGIIESVTTLLISSIYFFIFSWLFQKYKYSLWTVPAMGGCVILYTSR